MPDHLINCQINVYSRWIAGSITVLRFLPGFSWQHSTFPIPVTVVAYAFSQFFARSRLTLLNFHFLHSRFEQCAQLLAARFTLSS